MNKFSKCFPKGSEWDSTPVNPYRRRRGPPLAGAVSVRSALALWRPCVRIAVLDSQERTARRPAGAGQQHNRTKTGLVPDWVPAGHRPGYAGHGGVSWCYVVVHRWWFTAPAMRRQRHRIAFACVPARSGAFAGPAKPLVSPFCGPSSASQARSHRLPKSGHTVSGKASAKGIERVPELFHDACRARGPRVMRAVLLTSPVNSYRPCAASRSLANVRADQRQHRQVKPTNRRL
ncbi:hypothetical protein SAMN05216552_1015124 [Pseudoduganella namucuonensis]|uniref:Uncharacterized protein n=1 Tax=Pseudoduganella namucuonensis TaxID=1035707 RepID=A0A1I7K953_9BURK|nr:hypothetical protein SAMN05216552_1015124 [Pseudoduganella namucuonensis]